MAGSRNYLLGYGERLTTPVELPGGGGPKAAPYGFEEARDRLAPMVQRVASALAELPDKACPDGQAVASLTLHPEYYAKSHFPASVLRTAELRAVGSRPSMLTPERCSRDREPKKTPTTEYFVAGERSSFSRLADRLGNWTADSAGSSQLAAIERVSVPVAAERIRRMEERDGHVPLELVIHASEHPQDRFILRGFQEYLRDLDLALDLDRTFFAGNLCFLRLRAEHRQLVEIARFSFLRVLREMPRLRLDPLPLPQSSGSSSVVSWPPQDVLDSNLRVAVLDGGLPATSPLRSWTRVVDAPGVAQEDREHLSHGEQVTSAMLFGSINQASLRQPLCRVDHYRVLDTDSSSDPFGLYDVLERIKSVLEQGNYEFANLSIGPTLPVEDDDVHAWTAVLDEYLSDGRCLMSVAAGNTGQHPNDPVLSRWRIQIPADCVNGLTVGASDHATGSWSRARYSSKGPGRSPGIVKPDLVVHGGSASEPFWVSDPSQPGRVLAAGGTSFAAPAALRSGLAVRAHFGPVLGPLAIKALLIHRTEHDAQPRSEVGWGRLPSALDQLVICSDDCVRVVYQDEISPARSKRILLPLPLGGLSGMVRITATFCFATPVNPEHPSAYTKSGLSVYFRPHRRKFSSQNAIHPDTAPFFQPASLYPMNRSLRADAHKWETCLHRCIDKRATSLDGPVFDIHYNARSEGRSTAQAEKIRYALVLSAEAPRVKDLYDRVLQTYRNRLQPLVPILEIPLRSAAG